MWKHVDDEPFVAGGGGIRSAPFTGVLTLDPGRWRSARPVIGVSREMSRQGVVAKESHMFAHPLGRSLIVCMFGTTLIAALPGVLAAQTNLEGDALPPNAKVGECYARIFTPPTTRTTTERTLVREESERVEISPARYETAMEKVVVKPASTEIRVVPAVYEWRNEKVTVKPASTRLVTVAAVYETVTEKVEEKPAHTIWKKGRGPVERVDNATGEIMCLVEVPATYRTVTKRTLKTPATTREVEVPAVYTTVRKRVVKTPASSREVEVPAEYKTVKVTREVAPAEERRIAVPAQYQNITKSEPVTEGKVEWRPVLCETNATPAVVKSIQRALLKSGHNPGAIDGVLGRGTMTAVRTFQKAKGLPTGQLTLDTVNALGVSF